VLDATGLRGELLEGFAEEVGRPPTRRELAEVLSWSLPDADVFSVDPTGSSIEVPGPDQASDVPEDRNTSAVSELNDAVFGDATDLLIAVARHLQGRNASVPTLQQTIDGITMLLHDMGEDALADRSSSPVRFFGKAPPEAATTTNCRRHHRNPCR